MSRETDYRKVDYQRSDHHRRFRNFVENLPNKLLCQDCRGVGGWVEPVLEDGAGPFQECAWCEGTGFVSPWIRGKWLTWMRWGQYHGIRSRPETIAYFARTSKEIQKWVLERRPDLIRSIRQLHPDLKAKYQAELNLSGVEI